MEKDVIWLVVGYEDCGDSSYNMGAFKSYELAEHYCNLQTELSDDYCGDKYYVSKLDLMDDKVSFDQKVVPYYMYSINYDEESPLDRVDEYNDAETIKRIYDKDLLLTDEYDTITAYSTHSFEEAKQAALDYFKNTYGEVE